MPSFTIPNRRRSRRISSAANMQTQAGRACFVQVVLLASSCVFLGIDAKCEAQLTAPPLAPAAVETFAPSQESGAENRAFAPPATPAMQPPPLRNQPTLREALPATLADSTPSVSSARQASTKPRRRRPGDDLVMDSAEKIASHKTVQALLRQQVRMFGQTLVGNGAYRQSRRGNEMLLRMDMQLQLDDRAATFQQISDGRFLWKFRDSPDINKLGAFKQRLSRVDLEIVRRAVPIPNAATFPNQPINFDQGGMPQFVRQLVRNFTFDVPQSATLHDVPVWMLNGEWFEPALRRTMGQYRDPEDTTALPESMQQLLQSLPTQFPHQVSLAIGKDDLFPYRIEYRRTVNEDSNSGIVVKSNTRSMVTLELFQVQYDAPIDASYFVRGAGDLPVEDVTEDYLSSHGLEYRQAGRESKETRR